MFAPEVNPTTSAVSESNLNQPPPSIETSPSAESTEFCDSTTTTTTVDKSKEIEVIDLTGETDDDEDEAGLKGLDIETVDFDPSQALFYQKFAVLLSNPPKKTPKWKDMRAIAVNGMNYAIYGANSGTSLEPRVPENTVKTTPRKPRKPRVRNTNWGSNTIKKPRTKCTWPDCPYIGNQEINVVTHIRRNHFKVPTTVKAQISSGIGDPENVRNYVAPYYN